MQYKYENKYRYNFFFWTSFVYKYQIQPTVQKQIKFLYLFLYLYCTVSENGFSIFRHPHFSNSVLLTIWRCQKFVVFHMLHRSRYHTWLKHFMRLVNRLALQIRWKNCICVTCNIYRSRYQTWVWYKYKIWTKSTRSWSPNQHQTWQHII